MKYGAIVREFLLTLCVHTPYTQMWICCTLCIITPTLFGIPKIWGKLFLVESGANGTVNERRTAGKE